jgi:hypothetical protein
MKNAEQKKREKLKEQKYKEINKVISDINAILIQSGFTADISDYFAIGGFNIIRNEQGLLEIGE